MKGVILGIAPDVRIVDLTHEVPPQDVRAGAYLLRSAVSYFPPGTIHVAVVDPGVGSARRALVVATRRALYVAPDNGVLSLVAPSSEVRGIWNVSASPYRLRTVSRTFHGRDVFAPIAAQLALRTQPSALGRAVRAMIRLPPSRPRREAARTVGEVLWVDRFGNLITNIALDDLLPRNTARASRTAGRRAERAGRGSRRTSRRASRDFRVRSLSVTIGDDVLPLLTSYADVTAGRPLALINSNDLVEIAVNQGSAATHFALGPGARVVVTRR